MENKSLVKEHVAPIAHQTIGSILAFSFIQGLPSMIGLITALYAYLRGGFAVHWAILIGAVVLFLLSLVWSRVNHGRFKLTVDALADQPAGPPPPETLPCPDTWLHDVAEKDGQDISRVVRLTNCTIHDDERNWGSPTPYVIFTFTIFNGSVYRVSIDPKFEGFVSYQDIRLMGILDVPSDGHLENLLHGSESTFQVRQWLTTDEAYRIGQERLPEVSYFIFKELGINLIGGEGVEGVVSKPLRWTLFDRVSKAKKARLGWHDG